MSVTGDSVRYQYDDAGNVTHETVENGTDSRTTLYTYDDRGLTTSRTDPAGNTTEYGYDELGRPISVTAPAVTTESGGGTPTTSRPTTYTGYDTFGAITESVDALGRTHRTTYDRLGRAVTATAPAYTAPGSAQEVVPTVTHAYDALGNVTETTDPLGRVTRFQYDRQNRLTVRTCPSAPATSAASGGTPTPAPGRCCRSPTRTAPAPRRPTTTSTARSPPPGSSAGPHPAPSPPATSTTTRATW